MPKTSIPHLVRRGECFYFRRAVPAALRERLGRNEIRYSLKTQDRSVAKIRCRELSNVFDRLMGLIGRMPELSQKDIEGLLRGYFTTLWAKAKEEAYLAPQDAEIDLKHEINCSLSEADALRERIARRHYDGLTRCEAKELAEKRGITGLPEASEEFDALCNGILRARLEQHRIFAAMISGRYEEAAPKDPLFAGVPNPGLPPMPGEEAPEPKSVSAIVERYIAFKSKEQWAKKTVLDNRRILDWFSDFVGPTAPLESDSKLIA